MDFEYTQFMEVLRWLAGPAGIFWWAVEWSDMVRGLQEKNQELEPLSKLGNWLKKTSAFKRQMFVVVGYVLLPSAVALVINYADPEVIEKMQPLWQHATLLFAGLMAQKSRYNSKTK